MARQHSLSAPRRRLPAIAYEYLPFQQLNVAKPIDKEVARRQRGGRRGQNANRHRKRAAYRRQGPIRARCRGGPIARHRGVPSARHRGGPGPRPFTRHTKRDVSEETSP